MKEFIEKLIGRLEEKSFRYFNEGYGSESVIKKNSAISIVNQLAEEYGKDINVTTNGWIPCEKEMPLITGYFLVTIKGFSRPMYAWYLSTLKKWQYLNSTKEIEDVIAWQPLPAPYQPKGE